ncbi:MAG TPA: NUDIX domain-containing protein [Limnochordales bacterium]
MRAPKRMVACVTVRGETRQFPAEALRFRPAAYGIALRDGRVLVARSRFTGRWELPGGAVAPWETLEEGLRREYEEETGIPISVGECVGFDQGFIAFFQHPFNSLRFFYRVEAADVPARAQADEVTEVRWVAVADLSPESMAPGHHGFIRRLLAGEAGEAC